METKKMSLANLQGKLSRAEMKNIMAGSGGTSCNQNGMALCFGPCTFSGGGGGSCQWSFGATKCVCAGVGPL
jgi:hypothetical protein